MALPQFFVPQGGAVASYDWIDIVSGVGYRKFYCCASDLTGGTSYFLTPRALAGMPTFYVIGGGAGARWANNFDITFQRPAIVTGTGIFTGIFTTAGVTVTYFVITVSHVRGAVVTQLGTAQSATRAVADNFGECISMALTQQSFSIGDKLRVNVTLWSTGNVILYLDPSGALSYNCWNNANPRTTAMVFECPFKINI